MRRSRAGPWAWPWTTTAPCSSPTTWAASSGALPLRPRRRRATPLAPRGNGAGALGVLATTHVERAMKNLWLAGAAALALGGCLTPGSRDPLTGFGPDPPLPALQSSLIPSVGVPDVVHWAPGAGPR